ncbi:MAG: Dabb family protein [Vicinamibacteria bacterium]
MKIPTIAALAVAALATQGQDAAAATVLAHDVYFELKDDTPAARAALVAACKKYLTGHPGAVSFAAGTLVEEHARPVNDRAWDVALHIYFQDKASHDLYQEAARHKEFIAEQQGNWKTVRVFDSWVETGR